MMTKVRQRAPRRPDVTLSCVVCEKPFAVKACRAEKAKYCSQPCMAKGFVSQASASVTCAQCQKVFSRAKAVAARAIYCSRACQGEAKRQATTKVTLTCLACKKQFIRLLSRADVMHCSIKCAAATRVAKLELKPNAVCAHCKTPFRVTPARLKQKRVLGIFCSFACHMAERISARIKIHD